MMTSTNGLIAFFDLRNILCDSSKSRDELIFTEKCHKSITIYFYNNFYYFIDFSHCEIPDMHPILTYDNIDDYKKADSSIAINLQKETINAINALIYNAQKNKNKKTRCSDSIKVRDMGNDIDQFFIPNTLDKIPLPLSNYINSGTNYSSRAYEIACEAIYRKEPTGLDALDVAKQAIEYFNHLLGQQTDNYNHSPFYILAHLWKAIYYINHDLRIEASIQLRSVLETLVKSKYRLAEDKSITSQQYQEYLGSNEKEINDIFTKNKDSRDNAVHSLIIPDKKFEKGAHYIVEFFIRDFDIDIGGILK